MYAEGNEFKNLYYIESLKLPFQVSVHNIKPQILRENVSLSFALSLCPRMFTIRCTKIKVL